MTDEQITAHFKVLSDRLEKIEKAQGIFSTDLAKDREDLHNYAIEAARLGAIIESVRKGQNNQTEKMADKVEDVTDPVIEEIKGLKKIIRDKKFIALKGKGWKFWR